MLMTTGDAHQHTAGLKNYLETGEQRILGAGALEVKGVHMDGSSIDLELLVTEVEEGESLVFIGAMRDITQRKQTEEQLMQAQKMEAVGQLSGGIAHDFNNMLGIVIGNLDLIREKIDPDSPLSNYVELNRRLLAFSRRQSLQPESLDLVGVVHGMNNLIRSTVGEKIAYEIEAEEEIWPVLADLVQLESSIINIMINARDAMPNGGRLTLTASNKNVDAVYADLQDGLVPGNYVCLSITDAGSGMPANVLEHVFEPFYSTKELGKGTGLGLSMVFGFVKQSGGHLNIYSEVDRGTTVRIYLPCAPDHEIPQHQRAPEEDKDKRLGKRETILVVEDNDSMRQVVVNQLVDLNYAVVEAVDAQEALSIVQSGVHLDLVFSDVVMPGKLDGLGLREALREKRPDLKVLLTSGFVRPTEKGGEGGHQSTSRLNVPILTKPYRKQDLAEALQNIFNE